MGTRRRFRRGEADLRRLRRGGENIHRHRCQLSGRRVGRNPWQAVDGASRPVHRGNEILDRRGGRLRAATDGQQPSRDGAFGRGQPASAGDRLHRLAVVHFPDGVTPVDEIVRAVDDLATPGKVLYAGLANFPAWVTSRAVTLAELRGSAPMAAVQFEYSLVGRSADRETFPMAEALGIGAALWSPLGGGLLKGKCRSGGGGRLTDLNRVVHKEDERNSTIVDTVLAVADELAVPAAPVAVAWLLER